MGVIGAAFTGATGDAVITAGAGVAIAGSATTTGAATGVAEATTGASFGAVTGAREEPAVATG